MRSEKLEKLFKTSAVRSENLRTAVIKNRRGEIRQNTERAVIKDQERKKEKKRGGGGRYGGRGGGRAVLKDGRCIIINKIEKNYY